MAIRRRRKKLTNLVSRLDQRVRSVELRPVSLLTSGEVESAIVAGEELRNPTNVVSDLAPNQFRKVEDAYYYSKGLTGGSEDRVSIYLESDLQLPVGGSIEISGIHGTSTTDIDVSGVFEVKFTDTEPWADRASWKHDPTQDQLPAVTITNEYSIRPDTLGPGTWGDTYRRLQTKRLVDMFSITGNTVTLTMNAVHKFKVDDVIYVDIFAENATAFGEDGLFKVTAVTSDTIEYELFAGVDTPTGDITPSADFYVYPVARSHLPVGSTWSDSSTNTIYVWDGIRWVDYSAAGVEGDGDPPSAPTDLEITDEPKIGNETTGFRTYSEITFDWSPPTTSESGDQLTDLLGYRFGWRLGPTDDWTYQKVDDVNLSKYTLGPEAAIQQGETYYFKLEAYDSGSEFSQPAEVTHTTDQKTGDIADYPPTNPTLTTKLGTVTVTWDNRLRTGFSTSIAAPNDTAKMRVYISLDNINFDSVADATYFSSQNTFAVLTDLTYNSTYYVKITAINTAGSEGPFSNVVAIQPKALVDADAIASQLTEWPFNGQVIPAGSLADGSINASTLFGSNVIVQDAIAANAIGTNELAANSVVAGKIGANAIVANNIQSGSIEADKINSNAVTAVKIDAGAITTTKIAANAIVANKIDTGAVTADAINAGAITADKLESNFILSNLILVGQPESGSTSTSGRIEIRGNNNPNPGIVAFKNGGAGIANSVFRFYTDGRAYLDDVEVAGSLTVSGSVSGGTFTGGTFQTSFSGQRVIVDGSDDSINFRDSAGNNRGKIEGIADGLSLSAGFLSGNILLASFPRMRINSTDIATFESTGTKLKVVGSTTLSANLRHRGTTLPLSVSSSDERIKNSIEDVTEALDKISRLRPVTFNSMVDDTNKTVSGFLAQDVAKVFPINEYTIVEASEGAIPDVEGAEDLGFETDPLLSLNHIEIVPYLTKAIQELSQKNADLEARLEALEGN